MPNLTEFFATYRFDPVAAAFSSALLVMLLVLFQRAVRNGVKLLVFKATTLLAGLLAMVWIDFGFYSTWETYLRWAFVTKIALLLFAVPLIFSLGKPIELMHSAFGPIGRARLDRLLESRLVRVLGNPVFAPLFALLFFTLFLTPISGLMRLSPLWQALLTVIAPIFGLFMVLPLTQGKKRVSEVAMAGEFVFAFAELMFDAIPGLVLSINDTIFDGLNQVALAVAHRPNWFPTALNDQHFAGNLLWIIAEAADLPVLIMLFARWRRADREIAREVDDLSDAEFEALTKAHLGASLGRNEPQG